MLVKQICHYDDSKIMKNSSCVNGGFHSGFPDKAHHILFKNKNDTLLEGQKKSLNSRLNGLKDVSYIPLELSIESIGYN